MTDTEELTEPEVTEDSAVVTHAGWCAPTDRLSFPEITARRGGIAFTAAQPYEGWSKKRLQRALDDAYRDLSAARKREDKLRRKNRRLRKLVGKLA